MKSFLFAQYIEVHGHFLHYKYETKELRNIPRCEGKPVNISQ